MSRQSDNARRINGSLSPMVCCEGKVSFESFALADAVATRHARTKKTRRSAYRCAHCRKWHVGTDKGRVKVKQTKALRERKRHE